MHQLRSLLVIALPPLALAVIGLFHPHDLNGDTAELWTTLHVVLLPLFPLLAVSMWQLVRGLTGVLAWSSRAAAFVFIPLYIALDSLAGIATGTLMWVSGEQDRADVPALEGLFPVANAIGTVGSYVLLASGVLAVAAIGVRNPRWALFVPGGILLLGGLFVFAERHIYFPLGVASMAVFAVGAIVVELSKAASSQQDERTITP